MGQFREMLEESEITLKIKKSIVLDLSAKDYASNIPLCRKLHKDIKHICDLIENEGYYVLSNRKTYKSDIIISPENLAKISGATSTKTSFMIGKSEYEKSTSSKVSNKISILEITGDIIDSVVKNTSNSEYMDVEIIYGLDLSALTQDIALSAVKDGKYGGYFNKDKDRVKIHGSEGTIDTTKPFITWAQQHSSSPFTLWDANEVSWAWVSMKTMFPGAYNKSTIYKKDVFVIK